MNIEIYDTTLRDGAQGVGINFSVSDKLRIADQLDTLGVNVIEGGWPGANPTDTEFFSAMQQHPLRNATLAAFGATRRPGLGGAGRPATAHAAQLDGADHHAGRQGVGPAGRRRAAHDDGREHRDDRRLGALVPRPRPQSRVRRRALLRRVQQQSRLCDALPRRGGERRRRAHHPMRHQWRHAPRSRGDGGPRHDRSIRQHRRASTVTTTPDAPLPQRSPRSAQAQSRCRVASTATASAPATRTSAR